MRQAIRPLARWFAPPVPAHIRADLQQEQLNSIRKQVPMLLAVAALNTLIIMAVCANEGLPGRNWYWMGGLVAYCLVRIVVWQRRMGKPIAADDVPRLLRWNAIAALAMMTALGIATTWTFAAGTFGSKLLIPMSLGFGTTAIAHCLYTMRPVAIATIMSGLFPSSIALIWIGPFEAQMLGVSMISVGVLMIRFVIAQHSQLLRSLELADEVRRMALTDPLTGLANRRAIMAALDEAAASGRRFGVALIDLDGFKQVNDRMGHHVGDHLLREVADRLSAAACGQEQVGRLGGDEFVILFPDIADERACAARTTALLAALCRSASYDGRRLEFGASLGFAISGVHGEDVDALLQSADAALYAAKRDAHRQETSGRQSARLAA